MMELNKKQELMYWHKNPDWYYKDDHGTDDECFHIKDDAPQRAKDSFEAWKKYREEHNDD